MAAGKEAEAEPGPPWPLASKPELPGWVPSGSGRPGPRAALVPDDHRYRLPLGEPRAGSGRLIEPPRSQPLADLGHQIGLHSPQMRPGRQAHPPAQAPGRAFQPRRPFRVTPSQRQPGIPGQAQRHEPGAAGRQAQVQRLIQQRPGLIQPAISREPTVNAAMAVKTGSSWLRSSSSDTAAARRAPSKSPAIGKLHAMASWHTARRRGSWSPASSGARRWRGCQRGRVVAGVNGHHHRHPGQLGPGLQVQRVSGPELLNP